MNPSDPAATPQASRRGGKRLEAMITEISKLVNDPANGNRDSLFRRVYYNLTNNLSKDLDLPTGAITYDNPGPSAATPQGASGEISTKLPTPPPRQRAQRKRATEESEDDDSNDMAGFVVSDENDTGSTPKPKRARTALVPRKQKSAALGLEAIETNVIGWGSNAGRDVVVKLLRATNARLTGVVVKGDQFTDDEVRNVTSFWFAEVLGRPAVARLQKLMAYVAEHNNDEHPTFNGVRITQEAEAGVKPWTGFAMLKALATTYGHWQTGLHPSNSVLSQIYQNHGALVMYQAYRAAVESEREGKEISQWLQSRYPDEDFAKLGGPGSSAATPVLEAMARLLNVQVQDLRNHLQQAKCIYVTVETFGSGILALLPFNAYYTLNRVGIKKLGKILAVLDEEVGTHIKTIAELAGRTILSHLLSGGDLSKLRLNSIVGLNNDLLLTHVIAEGDEDEVVEQ